MYIPASFLEDDPSRLFEFIAANSFATLVSAGPGGQGVGREPRASHLPLLCNPAAGPHGQLIGHMAAANLHWQELDGEPALAIFTGPHAYISPTWYEAANVVPTWNYVAVHVHGTVHIERTPERLVEIVRAYVDFYEATMPVPWTLDSADSDFITRLLDAIVGFTIEITRIEGKRKLSQNHSPERRAAVIRGLQSLGGEHRTQIAQLMTETIAPTGLPPSRE